MSNPLLKTKNALYLQSQKRKAFLENFASNHAKIAQLVEHNLAKVRVAGSSPVFRSLLNAKVAQLVEHDLPKVGVAGSSPVFRSSLETCQLFGTFFLFNSYSDSLFGRMVKKG